MPSANGRSPSHAENEAHRAAAHARWSASIGWNFVIGCRQKSLLSCFRSAHWNPHGVAPNGTDILAPRAIAREIAPRVNAMIAPVTCSGKSQNRSRHSIKSTESGDCENLG